MPDLCRMNKYIIQGLIWLYIFSTGLFVVSLEPGYLDFDNLPDTNFSCVGKVIGGYYADLETNCQMFHVCTIGQLDEPMDIRFLCLNGTVFDQETRVCERIDEVDCSKSEKFYSLNLELYGNTAPPILEENSETESPAFEKSASSTTTTTTTTTTTARPPTTTTARTEYFTSSVRPVTPSPYHKGPSVHHFSLEQSPNYTPEEINISLNPGAPPNIRTKGFEFPHHNAYSDNIDNSNKKTVTTSSSLFKSGNSYVDSLDNSRISSSTTESERNSYNPNLQSSQSSQNNFKYNFNYHDTKPRDFNPSRANNYQYHHNFANFRPPILSSNSYHNNPYRSTTQRNEYLPVSRKNFEVNHPSSTSRSFFLQPIKSQSQQYFRTEKPDGNQLPLPALPTVSPIVFSSPAPFALSQHVETKRYTDEHELPPRIIISASASVSDASGRTLNYSLGTIGAAKILAQPPASYDDYKEEDVVLDPFYHDVPKISNNGKRTKRDTSGNEQRSGQSDLSAEKILGSESKRSKRTPQNLDPSEIIKSEEEAVEVLKFLFDWYKKQDKSTESPINIPVNPELISNINEQLSQRSYVPEDYEDDQVGILEKSELPRHQVTDPSNYISKSSHGNSLLHQASRGPSSNINSKSRDTFEARNNPVSSNYRENKRYEEKTRNFFDDYQNSPKPANQEVVATSATKSSNRGRPNRGRHRFTFPYATTPSHERFADDEPYYNRRTKVQNPSLTSYEELYERHKENNVGERNNYNVNNAKESRVSNFDQNNREYSNHGENHELNEQFSTPQPVTTTQEPVLQRLEEVTVQQTEEVTERTADKEEITTESNYQNYPGSLTYAATTSNYLLDDQSTSTGSYLYTNINNDNSKIVTKTSDYTYYGNDVKNNKDESRKSSKALPKSTEPYSYIDTYEYTDDNYEPAILSQNSEEEASTTNNEDVVRGIIHEETHVNIDLTETPEETTSNNKQENSLYPEETTTSINSSLTELNNTEQLPSENGNSGFVDTNDFKLIDKNITSFGDILSSLRNFQKYEQDIYNYQNNLTEIKTFEDENSATTKSEEQTSSSLIWETTTSDYTQVSNSENIKSERAEINQNVPIITTEKQETKNNILYGTEEESASSTRYFTVATESYETEDEKHLFTSKPFHNEHTTKNNLAVKLLKYEVLEEDLTTLPVTDEPTTSSFLQNDNPSNQTNEDFLSTTQSYEIGPDITESVNHSYKIGGHSDDEHALQTDEIEKLTEPTTVSSDSLSSEEKYDEFVSTSPKSRYRGRSRSRQRPSEYSNRRIENMPVSNSYRENTGRRRNSRRRQQNKPYYNLEPTTETSNVISTSPVPASDDNNLSEIATISNSVTENIINIKSFVHSGVKEKSSYESPPSIQLNSTPKGFYITKNKQKLDDPEYGFTTPNYNEESFSTSQNTEQNIVPTSTEPTAVPLSTEKVIVAETTDQIILSQSTEGSTVPQLPENSSDITTEGDFSVVETTSPISPTLSEENLSHFLIDRETTDDTLGRNEYEHNISTDSNIEAKTQTRLPYGFDHASAEPSSSASTKLTEAYTSPNVESTTNAAKTETSEILEITSDHSRSTTTTDVFRTTPVPTIFAYTTVNISEIEATTNSIVATESTKRYYKEVDENFEHTEESVVSTGPTIETTEESISGTQEMTTDYKTENIGHKEVENIELTTHAQSSLELETISSNLPEATSVPHTTVDMITEVHSATSNNKNSNRKASKSSFDNEIDNEQNKSDAHIKRDGRKYDRKTYNRNNNRQKSRNGFSPRHRFSSINVTPRTSKYGRPTNSYNNRFSSTQDVTQEITSTRAESEAARDVLQNISEKQEEETLTEISLPKNVKPTLATIKSRGFSTTPMLYKVELRKEKVNKNYVFNCFGKPLHQFYSDPRDCRLFHYCTNGYSKNQLLDMKFVCDLGTHFDDEKLVCTREIPKRCL